MQQEIDMDREEDSRSERVQKNDRDYTIRMAAVEVISEAIRGPKQPIDNESNNKIDSIKEEFRLEFRKLRDQLVEEVAKMTASLA